MDKQGKVILISIPSDRGEDPFAAVRVVREVRSTLHCTLKEALALVNPVRNQIGEVIVFTGDFVKATEFADRLEDYGCEITLEEIKQMGNDNGIR